MAINPFPLVDVSGAPFARGRQYGAQVADRVRSAAGFYGAQLAELGYDAADRTRLIGGFAGLIEDYGAAYIAEMSGIARGAGVPVEDVVLINARTEVVAKARAERDAATSADPPGDGCTAVAPSTLAVTSNIASVGQAANDTGAAASQVLSAAGDLSKQAEQLTCEVNGFVADVRAA